MKKNKQIDFCNSKITEYEKEINGIIRNLDLSIYDNEEKLMLDELVEKNFISKNKAEIILIKAKEIEKLKDRIKSLQ